MITIPHFNDARARVRPAPYGSRERCPFLEQVGDAQMPARAGTPAYARWNTELDPRADTVMAAFARSGGVVDCSEVTLMLRPRTSRPKSMLGRWLAEQRVVSFAWQGELVLPLFQFDGADMTLRAPVRAVLDELDGTFDDWELASWFALANAWLDDQAPVDMLDHNPDAVREAARADRFIARG